MSRGNGTLGDDTPRFSLLGGVLALMAGLSQDLGSGGIFCRGTGSWLLDLSLALEATSQCLPGIFRQRQAPDNINRSHDPVPPRYSARACISGQPDHQIDSIAIKITPNLQGCKQGEITNPPLSNRIKATTAIQRRPSTHLQG